MGAVTSTSAAAGTFWSGVSSLVRLAGGLADPPTPNAPVAKDKNSFRLDAALSVLCRSTEFVYI